MTSSPPTRILILGGGFGGVYTALSLDKTLAREPGVEVTLVSSENFLLFTPMLHEAAASTLNPSDIVNPRRRLFRHVRIVEAKIRKIDLALHWTADLSFTPVVTPRAIEKARHHLEAARQDLDTPESGHVALVSVEKAGAVSH